MKCPLCNSECVSSTWICIVEYNFLNCQNCFFSLKARTFDQLMEVYSCLRKTKMLLDQLIDLSDKLPNPAKLHLLAEWFDVKDEEEGSKDNEVQRDLREWAKTIQKMQNLPAIKT